MATFQVGDLVRIPYGHKYWKKGVYGVKGVVVKVYEKFDRVSVKLLDAIDVGPNRDALNPGYVWSDMPAHMFELVERSGCYFKSLL